MVRVVWFSFFGVSWGYEDSGVLFSSVETRCSFINELKKKDSGLIISPVVVSAQVSQFRNNEFFETTSLRSTNLVRTSPDIDPTFYSA